MPDAHRPLELRSSRLCVSILPFGAALVGVRLNGLARNLVLGFADPADHARVPVFAGALVGPIANRLRAGRIMLAGRLHAMQRNERGRTTLHSGDDGLHARLWQLHERSGRHVTLSCTLPDGACGLPGTRRITATYVLAGATLSLIIEARSDRTTAMNIASHPYWNLDGQHDVSGHRLWLATRRHLPTDADTLPTGKIADDAGGPLDFTTQRPVPLLPALDVNFCLSDRVRIRARRAAMLTGSDGTTLETSTNAPGLQVYNGSGLPQVTVPTDGCPAVAPYAGIALEPQHWPDAPHHTHFPQITLHPGEVYRQITHNRLSRG